MGQQVVVHLSLIEHIGPSMVHAVVDHIGYDQLDVLYKYTVSDFMNMQIPQAKAVLLVQGLADHSMLIKELALVEQYKAVVITHWDFEYPDLLKQIHIPPPILYVQGDPSVLKSPKMLACVGARNAHSYTKDVLSELVSPLIAQGFVIVSGGAAGADTFAHQLALDQGSKTVVVVGSGLCYVYPASNTKLFAQVVQKGGAVVSVFPMGMQPLARCFPARNRIIAGLSQGCLVLQAASKSGALITAQQALDQGRDVFAVPGSIFDPLSAGCHDLIKQGAYLVSSYVDLMQQLCPSYVVDDASHQLELLPIAKSTARSEQPSRYPASSLQQRVLEVVVVPQTSDHLMQKLGIDIATLQSILLDMSMDGTIEQDGMGFWVRL